MLAGTRGHVAGADRQQDPTLTGELPARVMLKAAGAGLMMPAAFFWYVHAGFRERWNNAAWNDPSMPRDFDAYYREAADSGGWGAAAEVAASKPPRVLLEVGGNTLRRTRGGKRVLLEAPLAEAQQDRLHGLPHVADGAPCRHRAAGDAALREDRLRHADSVAVHPVDVPRRRRALRGGARRVAGAG